MTGFVMFGGLLTLAAIGLVLLPLLRGPNQQLPRAVRTAALSLIVLAVGAPILYATLSNWSWDKAPPPGAPERQVAELARRVERNPDDLEGWLGLGSAYTALQQFPFAARAFQRADRLANGRNADALIGLAEALSLQDESELAGRAGRLIEQALVLEPRSGRALFYGAAAAHSRGELHVARERFAQLLALGPPENVRPILEQQIAALDAQIAQGAQGAAGAADTASGPVVKVNVAIAPSIRASIATDAPLFVILRDPARPGPPLAVKRLASHFPQSVALGAGDAMIAGQGPRVGQKVQVVARVSRSGSPTAQSGDPFGEKEYEVGGSDPVEILIDRLTP